MTQITEHEAPDPETPDEETSTHAPISVAGAPALTSAEQDKFLRATVDWIFNKIPWDLRTIGLIAALILAFGDVFVNEFLPVAGHWIGIEVEDLPFPTRNEFQRVLLQQCQLLKNDCTFAEALEVEAPDNCAALDCSAYITED